MPLTTVVFTTTQSWPKPSDWNPLSNTIICIGGGGNGAAGVFPTIRGAAGGGGGACSVSVNVNPSFPVTVTVGGTSVASSFGSLCNAGGGGTASGNSSGAGGIPITFNSLGFSGGSGGGGSGGTVSGGAGGGGAAGINGAGGNGGAANDTISGANGGSGDNGTGGSGGIGGSFGIAGGTGGNGTEIYNSLYGSGGGGGGDGAANAVTVGSGGNGGNYGAGGGGGSSDSTVVGGGGSGTQGLVIVQYTPTEFLITPGTSHDFLNPRFPNLRQSHLNSLDPNLIGQDFILSIQNIYDYPNPRGPLYPTSLRTWTENYDVELAGQDIVGLSGVGPNYDFPNPLGYKFPLENRTYLNSDFQSLVAQVASTFYGTGQALSNYDWPVPRGYLYPISNRTFLGPLNIGLISSQQVFYALGETTTYDYPNPKGYRRSIDLLTWTHPTPFWLQDLFLGETAGNPNEDWPNPKGYPPPRFLYNFISQAGVRLIPINPNIYGTIIG